MEDAGTRTPVGDRTERRIWRTPEFRRLDGRATGGPGLPTDFESIRTTGSVTVSYSNVSSPTAS